MSEDLSAFPFEEKTADGSHWHSHAGMSLRDWFAGQALPAVIAAYVEANGRCIGSDHIHGNCAGHAYRAADAMLAERGRAS